MKRFLILTISLLSFVHTNAQAEYVNSNFTSPSPDTLTTNIPQDIEIGFKTGLKLVPSPAHFDSNDLIYSNIAIAATGLTFLLDDEIRSSFGRSNSKALDNLGEIGHRYGDLYYMGGISAGVFLSGKIFGSESFSVTGRMLLEGLFYAGATTIILKTITGRSRPYMNEGNTNFKWFQTSNDYNSMPSGHCTVAFAFSSVLAERIDNVYASIFLYGLAVSTVVQRMYSDNHWASDCIAGSVIGYVIGKAVVKFDKMQKENNINLSAIYLPSGAGINLRYSF
ncbi:MAG: phosphatase PAP2 family protein [Melioribacteraceae bacterium]|nr:phosphatase PAP2 family protein [Melioribacteraceae bacterium]